MARKAVLEGGKRDEIVLTAMRLFLENGYEATSVRMILDKVGGEVGMFYHYFKSKDDLFEKVIDRFFLDYRKNFERMAEKCTSEEQFVKEFLLLYTNSMVDYSKIKGNMHWTIKYAMHARTVQELIPVVEDILKNFGYHGDYPLDITAARVIANISAIVHSHSFESMSPSAREEIVLSILREIIQ